MTFDPAIATLEEHPGRVAGPWIVADLHRGQVWDHLDAVPLYVGHGWISGSTYWLSRQDVPAELDGVSIMKPFNERILETIAAAEQTMRDRDTKIEFGQPFADGAWPRAHVFANDDRMDLLVNPNYVWWLQRQHKAHDWRQGEMAIFADGRRGPAFFLLNADDELRAIVAPCRAQPA